LVGRAGATGKALPAVRGPGVVVLVCPRSATRHSVPAQLDSGRCPVQRAGQARAPDEHFGDEVAYARITPVLLHQGLEWRSA
jgi:hypothetical protein